MYCMPSDSDDEPLTAAIESEKVIITKCQFLNVFFVTAKILPFKCKLTIFILRTYAFVSSPLPPRTQTYTFAYPPLPPFVRTY